MSKPVCDFPRELHSKSNKERVEYFKERVIRHPHYIAAYEQLMRTLQYRHEDMLVLVYGPSRAGKTTLLDRVFTDLKRIFEEAMRQNPGIIPVIAIQAVCQGNFNWKDFHKRLLHEAQEPMADQKRDPDSLTTTLDKAGRYIVRHGGTGSDLRWMVEQCFRHRQVQILLVDEAQHLTFNNSGRRQQIQMEIVKSFTSLTHTTQVLFGTYDLLALRQLSAQLSCRTREIHLPRYLLKTPEDEETFRGILRTFQGALPLAEEPNLVRHWEYCYARSAGCIGVLKEWLMMALVEALETKKETVTKAILEKTARSKQDIASIVRELLQGEDKINRAEPSEQEFRGLLGLPDRGAEGNGPSNGGPQPRGPSPKPRRPRVGERKPTRDPVGRTGHAA